MPVVIQKEWYTKKQIQEDRDIFFLFGDNTERTGTGGQAKHCRNEPNCIGVATKIAAHHQGDAYMYDDKLEYNCATIARDFLHIIRALRKGKTVIFPADGIGTGLAKLPTQAPLTYEFVQVMWDYCIKLGEQIGHK